MNKYIIKSIEIPIEQFENADIVGKIAALTGLLPTDIANVILHKRSIDARKKNQLKFVCSYVFETVKQPQNAQAYVQPQNIFDDVSKTNNPQSIVVVGSGPAGLFAARLLSKVGHTVTVVERGDDIDDRIAAVQNFNKTGVLDVNSNIQFGLGGAGSFSDGKLTCGISSPFTYTVFQEFVDCGAPLDILTSAMPHIGTDNLVKVVCAIKDKIVENGGRFLFNTTFCDLKTVGQTLSSVSLKDNKTGKIFELACDKVVLATGHSARDTFQTLLNANVNIVSKPFAVGVRIEHNREFISLSQYGSLAATHRDLQSASYKMAANFDDGRSCYTFCMCPGGVVVAASSCQNSVVTNGMSNFARNGTNSNSALVVNVTQADFGNQPMSGVEFQTMLESAAFNSTINYKAPCQNVVDFLQKKKSLKFDIEPTYPLGVKSVNLWEILPQFVCQTLEKGLIEFGKKIKGFDTCGVLTAVESRTSSPIKILRDENFESNIKGLYPCGEGSGFSGGIVSAAIDGLKVALSLAKN